jgi:hypothetical protein
MSLKKRWEIFKRDPPGQRFLRQYARHQARAKDSKLARFLIPLLALLSFAIGVILAVIPGPAFVFFGISAALIAMQSERAARAFDRLELSIRKKRGKLRA